MADKTRLAQVGLGSRSEMYSMALVEMFQSNHELVAVCDTNAGRAQQRANWVKGHGVEVKTYAAGDLADD